MTTSLEKFRSMVWSPSGGVVGGPWWDRSWTSEEQALVCAHLEKVEGLLTLDALAQDGESAAHRELREALNQYRRHQGPPQQVVHLQFEICLMVALAQWRAAPLRAYGTEQEQMPGGFIMSSTGYVEGRSLGTGLREHSRLISSNTSDLMGCTWYCSVRTRGGVDLGGPPVTVPDFAAFEEYVRAHVAREKAHPPQEAVVHQEDAMGIFGEVIRPKQGILLLEDAERGT